MSSEASTVSALTLVAGDGDVTIVASDDDEIRVEVVIRENPDYRPRLFHTNLGEGMFRKRAGEQFQAAKLHGSQTETGLEISLTPEEADLLVESWRVEVPAHLATAVRLDSGRINVSGLTGGVDVTAREARIDLDLPGGPLAVDLSVGNVVARTHTESQGEVKVVSGVGDVDLWLHGNKVVHDDRPGPGSRVGLKGAERDRIALEVEVGDIDLHIN